MEVKIGFEHPEASRSILVTHWRSGTVIAPKAGNRRIGAQSIPVQRAKDKVRDAGSVRKVELAYRDEKLMAIGYQDGIVRVFRAEDGHELATIPAHTCWVTGTVFTPDGKCLATSSEDGLVKLWDPITFRQLATLKGHLLGVHSVAVSPDGRRLATGSNAKDAIKIWDLATRQELLNLEGEGSQFDRTQFSPDGNLLVSVNSEGLLHYWRAPSMVMISRSEAAR